LYALESAAQDPELIFSDQSRRQSYDSETVAYARRIFTSASNDVTRIDAEIRAAAAHWDFERIGAVEKNILRAAIAELRSCPDTPAAVIIDEAVELAKDYAGSESGGFVNGILDRVYKRSDENGDSALSAGWPPKEVEGD
jgi:N utilization substance protein B